ncbi:hypothetical protein DNHGIG_15220 [Collibacillus ludicampi]|uniref:XkdX family protein n=1 Tax=Collibacillus ludicampi TaxID=2771369 RepID=A0AAV4LE89_9BACL|nr:XkdX family protein [Collibacillus ludicampi]GIM45973.1 hypothetical protein DNHGIG_15220 [Collibacillus ludicampi]
MTPFDFWKMAYQFKWATLGQLQKAVSLGLITQDEYNQITGTAQQ